MDRAANERDFALNQAVLSPWRGREFRMETAA
jgi:hypothetical protein